MEFDPEAVIRTPSGLPGFPAERAFLLVQLDGQYPLVYLQSITTPSLCFPALPVAVASSSYQIELAEEDRRILGLSTRPAIGRDVLCLSLLAAEEDGRPTVNLLAPVVVDIRTRTALQCINGTGGYSLRHPLDLGAAA